MEVVTEKPTSKAVPEGYKRTEVGVIPEEWELKRVDDFTQITAGGTPSTKVKKYWGGNIKWMNSGELNKKFIHNVEGRITNSGLKNSSTKEIPAKSVLIGLAGQGKTRGTAAFNYTDLCINQSIAAIFPSNQHVPKYLYYNIDSRYYELRAKSTGQGGRGGLNLGILGSLKIPLPPTLEEQRAIAESLGDVDALIAEVDALIEKKQQIKKGAMQQLLTAKKRLPGFGGEWEVKKLGDVCDVENGGTPSTKKSEYWDGNISWCTPTDITSTNGKYLSKTERKITELGLKNSSATLLPKGALLLCSRATVGEIKIAVGKITTNQGFKSLICSEQVDNEFLYYLIILQKQKFIDKAFGSTFLEISKKNTKEIEFQFPSLEEQKAIASILSDMDAEIQALQAKRAKYEKIKHGMMQELLTGKTRLV